MTDREETLLRAWQCVTAARVDALEEIVGKMLAPTGGPEKFLATWVCRRTEELAEASLQSAEPPVVACVREILELRRQDQKAAAGA